MEENQIDELTTKLQQLGFNAVVYQNGQDVVLSFEGTSAGTSSFPDWIYSNVPQIAAGQRTGNQYEFALALTLITIKLFGSENVVLTGHSLGGGLAQYAASELPIKAVTFDAAGIKSPQFTNSSNILNVRLEGDVVSSGFLGGEALGANTYVFPNQNFVLPRPFSNHKMENLINSMYNEWKGKSGF